MDLMMKLVQVHSHYLPLEICEIPSKRIVRLVERGEVIANHVIPSLINFWGPRLGSVGIDCSPQ